MIVPKLFALLGFMRRGGNAVQSIMAFGVRAVAGVATYVMFAVIARLIGTEKFGEFSVIFSAIMLAGFVGSFGQQVFLVKILPEARAEGNKPREMGAYFFSLCAVLCAGGVSAVVFAFVMRDSGLGVQVFGGAMVVLFAISQATIGALRVLGLTIFSIFTRDVLWRVLAVLLMFIAAVFTPNILQWGGGFPVVALAVCLFAVVLLHLSVLVKKLGILFNGVKPNYKGWKWLEMSIGFALVAVISSADLYVYTIALAPRLPGEEVGAFFAALKTGELLNLFLMAVSLIVGPELSRIVAARRYVDLQQVCNNALILQVAPLAFACLVLMLAAPEFMWIYNPSYQEFSGVLRIVAVGMLINAITGSTGLLLQLSGLHWLQVVLQLVSLGLGIVLLGPLINWLGLSGAGCAFVISKTLWNVAAILALRKKLSVDPSVLGLFDKRTGGVRGALSYFFGDLKGVEK